MNRDLATLAAALGQALASSKQTLATAESCTGGGLSYWITHVAGSSAWFERGFVTYSNDAKIEMLGVNPETLKQFGAVSEATAREMAEGALKNSRADMALSITGIAGPTGGSLEKPVGTVWIGLAAKNKTTLAFHAVYKNDRDSVREAALIDALTHLLNSLN